ncbi:YidC/Oxa1 family membrane protein insertase [Anaerofilum sp. BX8]|uniref:YidC/Oxa1 family membrane protein insertase n=1 Tax=Anaerofilum hominis TaxID=2763016 RepID=A0A923RH58_9FIRM|nr:YidC/Oxa1 family membrane protein insertase [Anaerofilum hominis]MBC5582318.1 YidC/Oxa1 family membrane protein insertase [Anaerofilum hominis]
MSFLGFLGGPLGYVMEFIYKFLVSDYGLSLVLFTIVLRVLMFPLRIKQQKSTARMSAYQPMILEIQKKYAKDKNKQQEELMKLQEEYGYSPTAGCLPMLLNFVVIFGIIEVVYRPLTYILHIPAEVITAAADAGSIAAGYAQQSGIISAVVTGNSAVMSALGDSLSAVQGFNVFWGNLNLAAMPTISLAGWMTLIFPVLSVVTMVASQIIIQKTSGQEMQGSMKWMPWLMSAMFIFVGFTVPVGFSLYYTVSNILMVVESLIAKKIYDPEKMKAQLAAEIEEKRKAKKAKKKVTVKTDDGAEIKKEVTESELASIRLQRAREIDAERYADERTEPLTEEERAALEAEQGQKKKKKSGKQEPEKVSANSEEQTERLLAEEKAESEKLHKDEE